MCFVLSGVGVEGVGVGVISEPASALGHQASITHSPASEHFKEWTFESSVACQVK